MTEGLFHALSTSEYDMYNSPYFHISDWTICAMVLLYGHFPFLSNPSEPEWSIRNLYYIFKKGVDKCEAQYG
jgi:hypothetical protein